MRVPKFLSGDLASVAKDIQEVDPEDIVLVQLAEQISLLDGYPPQPSRATLRQERSSLLRE